MTKVPDGYVRAAMARTVDDEDVPRGSVKCSQCSNVYPLGKKHACMMPPPPPKEH